MRKSLLIFLLIFVVGGMGGCATFNTENQTARIGVKATTMVLIDKGHIEKEKLEEVVDLAINLLNEGEGNIEEIIKKQIGFEELSPPAKLAVDEFILSIKDNVNMLDVEIPEKERILIVLGWVKDALKYY
jgi:hypothetical protein